MDLGEQIQLEGFLEQEPGDLLIAKKLIGNHVKGIIERSPGFERLALKLDYGTQITITGVLTIAGSSKEASGHDVNVFFALDKCLKALAKH